MSRCNDPTEKAKARSRAVGRKLKDVQELPVGEATVLLPHNLLADEEELVAHNN